MSPRTFDRFMADVRNGTNFKLARLTHAQYRAFFSAVLPIAALSDVRGAFMVHGQPATAEDMRIMAPKLTVAECRSALTAFRQLGMLEHDPELGGEWVHDFEEWNPEPKRDETNAERQRRYREKQKASRNAVTNGGHNGAVTPPEVEVEVEGEKKTTPPTPPPAGGKRAKLRYEGELAEFCIAHFPGVPAGLVAHLATDLRARKVEPTVEALRPLVERWHPTVEAPTA